VRSCAHCSGRSRGPCGDAYHVVGGRDDVTRVKLAAASDLGLVVDTHAAVGQQRLRLGASRGKACQLEQLAEADHVVADLDVARRRHHENVTQAPPAWPFRRRGVVCFEMSYEHILVAYDGTSEGDEAVRAGAELARREGAQLTVATVVELEQACRGCSMNTNVWNDVMRDYAQADLERARELLDMPADLTVLCGPPGRALTDGARDLSCDAIMLPARSGPLAKVLRRDRVPRSVRRRAHCAVLQPQ
jgi:nucleotide-binding universal stress UspA family protein